ncbi:unnamed protein product [Colletotrichum noveboracense]|uniref:Uncharacterized protein n=1 Tax=Colletotrichum noveboracense TaxID=2664923 RepID=A0A9W4RVB8_9PEZI|nr:unnamed protein product [Colletotrichum noveboracense]
MSSPINSPNPSTPPTHDKARDQSRHSQTMTNPEVFFYAERLTELTRLKCFHGHLNPVSGGYPRPASCPRCYYRVQDMAELFYQTCPGDWQGDGAFLKECLKAAAWGNTNPDVTIDIGAFVSYRWKLILLADQLIKDLGLPVPGNKTCAMWNEYVWRGEVLYNLEGFWEKYHWGPDVERFRRYLAASVMQADLPFKPTLAMIDRVVDYVGRAKNADADFRLRWQRL